jgi:ammonia channel protein AmtB
MNISRALGFLVASLAAFYVGGLVSQKGIAETVIRLVFMWPVTILALIFIYSLLTYDSKAANATINNADNEDEDQEPSEDDDKPSLNGVLKIGIDRYRL